MARLQLQLKKAVASVLCSPPVGRALGMILSDRISCRGSLIDTSDPMVAPEVKAMLFFRVYESAELRFVKRYLRGNLDVIELGASLGVVSCQIARRLAPGRRLISVEANPKLAQLLARNLALNSVAERVTVVNAAIAYDKSDRVALVVGRNSLGGSVGSGGEIMVPAKTLSEVAADLGNREFALVSDIEGAEAGLLLHEAALLQRCRQMIIESHDAETAGRRFRAQELIDLFCSTHGFTLRDQYGPVAVLER